MTAHEPEGGPSREETSQPLSEDRGASIHDFTSKLTQESVINRLDAYVKMQHQRRVGGPGNSPAPLGQAPLSINLDLTTACNYACDHCIDMDILNQGIRFENDRLLQSITNMAEHGLRSIILIGGGEPTVYPLFGQTLRHIKKLGLGVGIVTNGSRLDRILEVAECLDRGDWLRLSLDSGTDATFQAMHKPRKRITLEQICAQIPAIKQANSQLAIGFSFIITWKDCNANHQNIHENLDEMVEATRLAKAYKFDYISFKPFLVRLETNNAETVGLSRDDSDQVDILDHIRSNLERAHALEDDGFRVVESSNLVVLERGTAARYTHQPGTCHMTFFRQVVSPLGVYCCPVYRNVPAARIGDKNLYSDPASAPDACQDTLRVIDSFDASTECREVTCLYNDANWFVEDLVQHPEKIQQLNATPDRNDYFF